jgi:hypothetical protein
MKKIISFLVIFFVSLAVGKTLHFLKNGFSARRVQSLSFAVHDDFSDEVKKALQQPFHYIGRGRQCFAFASEDEKYVLKFPRTDIYKTPLWVRAVGLSAYRKKLEANHKKREAFILESFKISSEELKEQTGILALHLGQSFSKGQFLTLLDAAHCKHLLPLERASFVLQYKHPILMKAFSEAIQKKEQSQAEKILDALLAAIHERASHGILNRDRSFLRNYGFDGEKAYQIDVGSFFKNPHLALDQAYQKSIRDSVDPIREWLSQYSPETIPHLNQKLKEFNIN